MARSDDSRLGAAASHASRIPRKEPLLEHADPKKHEVFFDSLKQVPVATRI
jgi:hypothetical protein